MAINADKLLNKSSGRLAMQKAQQEKMVGGGPVNIVLTKKSIKGIESIKINVIKIENILKGSLALDKKQLDDKKKATSGKRRENIETKLETKPNAESGKVKMPSAPRMGILDFIKNFIGNVLLGYFAVRLIKHLPKIMPIVKFLGNAADFIIDVGGKLLNGLVTFIDIGYKAYDATRGFIKNLGGENFAKGFDKFIGAIDTALFLTTVLAGSMAMEAMSGGSGPREQPTKQPTRTTSGGKPQGRPDIRNPLRQRPTVTTGGGTPRPMGGGPKITGSTSGGSKLRLPKGIKAKGGLLGLVFLIPDLINSGMLVSQGRGKDGIRTLISAVSGVAAGMAAYAGVIAGAAALGITGVGIPAAIALAVAGFGASYFAGEAVYNLTEAGLRKMGLVDNDPKTGKPYTYKGGGVTRGGRSQGRARRTISKGKYKRVLAPQKPLKTEFKDKKVKKRTEELDKTKYFGPILAVSSKIMNKEEPTDRDYQNVGLGINLLIAKGIQDKQLKGGIVAAFANGGLVDPDVLSAAETGGDISNWVAKTFRGEIESNAEKTLRMMKEMREGEEKEKKVPGSGGGGGDDPGGTIELKGNMASKSVQLAKRLQQMFGLKDFQAAAIVGTWLREGFGSGYPDVRQGGKRGAPTYDAPSTDGYGFAQWTNTQGGGPNDRLNRAMIFLGMKDNPRSWTVDDNLKVFKWEIDTKGYGSAISKLKETTNIRDAVRTFVGIYEAGGMGNISKYEGQEGGGFIERRLSEAQGVLRYLASGKDDQGKALEQAVLGNANLASGDGSFIQGNSGASDGTHFHVGTNKPGDASGSTSAAFSTIKHFLGKKSVYVGRSNETIPTGATDDEIRGYIARGMAAHATKGRGQTEIDLQIGGIGAGNKVAFPLGLSGMKYSSSDGYGTSANITGTNAFVGHGRYKPDGTLAAQQNTVLNTGAPDFYLAKGGRIHKPIIALIGEKGPEFVFDADTTRGLDKLAPQLLEKLNFASTKPQLASILQSYASYDTMSPQTIVVQSPSAPSGSRNNNSSGGGVTVIPIPVDNFTEILAMIG
jgi:hypothetical protein